MTNSWTSSGVCALVKTSSRGLSVIPILTSTSALRFAVTHKRSRKQASGLGGGRAHQPLAVQRARIQLRQSHPTHPQGSAIARVHTDTISIISIINHSDTAVHDYPDEETYVDDRDAGAVDHRWRPVAAIAAAVLILAVIATALIVYGGESASTTATVEPPPTRRVIATPRPGTPTAAPLPPETVTTLTPPAAPTTTASLSPTAEPGPSPEPTPPPAVDPRTVVYSVTGTKQVFDVVSVIYTDAQGLPQTDFNVSLPWSKTIVLNPGVQTKSVIATSLAGRLNCTITTADGQLVAASATNTIIATCAR